MKIEKSRNLVLLVEFLGFASLIVIVWLDELINLPVFFFGPGIHQIDIEEAILESIVILAFGLLVISISWYLIKRIGQLEKFIPICAFCKKIRKPDADPEIQNSWEQMEHYINKRTGAMFSHSVCPACEEKHYGDQLRKFEKARKEN